MKRVAILKTFVQMQQVESFNLDRLKNFKSINKDTRTLQKGDLYIAIKGDNFDGNQFAIKALSLGTNCLILNREIDSSVPQIIVNDSILFLQQWAKYYRENHSAKFIGITGTNGKTTTKEMLYSVLKKKFRTYRTAGNYNNHIGVPLTILNMDEKIEIAVIELGMSNPKEIEFLANIIQPDYSVITNISVGHMLAFSSISDIYQEKIDLFLCTKKNGVIILNMDDIYLKNFESSYHVIKKISSQNIKSDFYINLNSSYENRAKINDVEINLKIAGKHNIHNAAIAVAFGKIFHVGNEIIKIALNNFQTCSGRMELIKSVPFSFIHDAYNANPTSTKNALVFFANYKTNLSKIVVLGDMLELGRRSAEEHQKIIDDIGNDFKMVYTFGSYFKKVRADKIKNYSSISKLGKDIKSTFSNGLILLKGSRGMRLERLIKNLTNRTFTC